MTETQIQYFFAVFKYGNIANAAKELHVSRPVVSRAISEIEKKIEFRLFDRTSGGIIPTEQGIVLYNLLSCFEKNYTATIEKLRNPYFTKESQELRIGIMNASSNWFYPTIYRIFHNIYPDAAVNVRGIQAEKAAEFVLNGHLDIAIAPLLDNNIMLLSTQYLYTTQWVLCSPKESVKPGTTGIAISESKKLSMAFLETLPPPFYEYKDIVLSIKDPDVVRLTVANGYANAVLPMELCAYWDDVAVIPFNPPQTSQIYLIWNDTIPHNSIFNEFFNVVNAFDFEPLRKSWGAFKPDMRLPEYIDKIDLDGAG